jgi:Flp pilus assembly protein TadG
MNPVTRLRRDERGMSILYVTTGFLAFFVATTLAIDVGMLTTARAQAQNAADAGALAGAIALALDDWDDRSPSGPAVQAAVNAASENLVMGGSVAVEPADVTFPVAPNAEANRVRVMVYRTAARNNPLSTFIAGVFGVDTADMTAVATAHAAPANAMTCVRPFTIPDKWIENSIPPNNTFDRYNNKGEKIENADEYRPAESSYEPAIPVPDGDKGRRVTLRAGTGNNIAPTFYYSWSMPGDNGDIGGDFYEDNIKYCNRSSIGTGQWMTQEPGNMMGPTMSGIDELIAQDPTAYYDDDDEKVVSPLGRSPRVFPIPLYNPDLFQLGKMTGRNATLQVAGWIGFFVENRTGNEVYGRIVPMLGTIDPNGPAPEGAFPRAVQLVE